jgi:hypothetical protein
MYDSGNISFSDVIKHGTFANTCNKTYMFINKSVIELPHV